MADTRVVAELTVDVKAAGAVKALNDVEKSTKQLADTEAKRLKAQENVERRLSAHEQALGRQSAAYRRAADAVVNLNSGSIAQNATLATGSFKLAAVTAAVVALASAYVKLISIYADFQVGVIRTNAVLQVSGAMATKVSSTILMLGRTTVASFNDISKAAEQLGRAGLGAETVLQTLPLAINLSVAAGTGLVEATEIIIRTMYGFGIAVEDLGGALDTLAFISIKTNGTVSELGESMKYIAPIARIAGVEFEEVSAALGLMGNAGILASIAGTTLRSAVARLVNPTREASRLMQQFGLENEIVNGKLSSLANVIEKLEQQKATPGDIFELFDLRAGPGMAALLAVGADGLRKLTEEARNAKGVMKELAEQNMEALTVKVNILTKSFQAVAISMGEALSKATKLNYVFDVGILGVGKLAAMLDRYNVRVDRVADVTERLKALGGIQDVIAAGGMFGMGADVRQFRLKEILGDAQISAIAKENAKTIQLMMSGFKGSLSADSTEAEAMLTLLEVVLSGMEEAAKSVTNNGVKPLAVEMDNAIIEIEGYTNAQIAAINPMTLYGNAIDDAAMKQEVYLTSIKRLLDPTLKIADATQILQQIYEHFGETTEELRKSVPLLSKEWVDLADKIKRAIEMRDLDMRANTGILHPQPQFEALAPQTDAEMAALSDIEFSVPKRGDFDTMSDYSDAFQQWQNSVTMSGTVTIPKFTEEMRLMGDQFFAANDLIESNKNLIDQGIEGMDNWSASAEDVRFALMEIAHALDTATDAQRSHLEEQQNSLGALLLQLEDVAKWQTAIQLIGTVADSVANSFLNMMRTGVFSFKALGKAIAQSVAAELAAIAVKEVVLGFVDLAQALSYSGTPWAARLAAFKYAAAATHFKAAALAGAGAGAAAALGGGGGGGGGGSVGQNNAPITAGADAAGSARTPTVTVIFEGGSNVMVQDRETFGREIAEQVKRAIADGV